MAELPSARTAYGMDTIYRDTDYAEHLKANPRWSRYLPDGLSSDEWRRVLHADSDGLDQARLMIRLAELFLMADTENSAGLDDEQRELLLKAMAAQNWGKSYDDDDSPAVDVSYEFITQKDVEDRKRKFHVVYGQLVPGANIKERFIVEKTIYDRTTRLGAVFDAIRRLNCLRTGLIAYDRYIQDPNQPGSENLGALSIGVLSNQLIPLIGYAEQFAPVKKVLEDVKSSIDTIFADATIRDHSFVNLQQTLDVIERVEAIWERSYGEGAEIPSGKSHRKNETLFSPHSLFDKRYINDKEKLGEVVRSLRELGMKIVLTSGSFDLLHIGHAAYLERASEYGDVLIVGVDSDSRIKHRKGPKRPIVSETERLRLLTHLRGVDIVTMKEPDDEHWELIKLVRPDVLIVTAETYKTSEIKDLEQNYCGNVVVLEPQATTSTGARIRMIEIGAATAPETSGDTVRELGRKTLQILSQYGVDQADIIKEIAGLFDEA